MGGSLNPGPRPTPGEKKFRKWLKANVSHFYYRCKETDVVYQVSESIPPVWGGRTDPIGYLYVQRISGDGAIGSLHAINYQSLVPITEMEAVAWAAK